MDDITASIIVTCQTSGAAANIDKLGFSIGMLSKKIFQFGVDSVREFQKTQDAAWKFGKTFPNVMGSAEKAVSEFKDTYNLSEQTARQMLTDTAQVLKGMGFAEKEALKVSESVSRWGVDLASFTGYAGGAKGAVEAITAAMLGENERLKGLGIVIREDTDEFKNLTKEMMTSKGASEQEARALAKLELITRKAADAKGDYMAEGENFTQSVNNVSQQWAQVKSNIGEVIYEVLGLNDAVGGIGDWLREVNKKWEESGALWTYTLRIVWIDVKTAFELAYVVSLKPFFVAIGTGFENIGAIMKWFSDNWGKIWNNAGDITLAVLKDIHEYFKWMFGLDSPIVSLIITFGKSVAKSIKAAFTGGDVAEVFTSEFSQYVEKQSMLLSKQGANTAEALKKAGVSAFPDLKGVAYDFYQETEDVLRKQRRDQDDALARYTKSLAKVSDKEQSSVNKSIKSVLEIPGQIYLPIAKQFKKLSLPEVPKDWLWKAGCL